MINSVKRILDCVEVVWRRGTCNKYGSGQGAGIIVGDCVESGQIYQVEVNHLGRGDGVASGRGAFDGRGDG